MIIKTTNNEEEEDINLIKTKEQAVTTIPHDKYKLIFFTFILQGVGTVFPMAAMLSAPDYFIRLYGSDVMLYLSMACSFPNIICLLFLVKFGSYIPLKWKVYPAYIISFLALITIPILAFTEVRDIPGFSITVTLVAIQSMCCATLSGSIFGLVGKLPANYLQGIMIGSGASTVACSLLRVLTKLTIEQGKKHLLLSTLTISASIFYFSCAVLIVICVVTFFFVLRTDFVKYYIEKAELRKEQLNNYNNNNNLTTSTALSINETTEEEPYPIHNNNNSINNNNDKYEEQEQQISHELIPLHEKPSLIKVFKKIWLYCLLGSCSFWVTLSIFPGLALSIPTWYKNTIMVSWFPILMNTTFSVFDFLGRLAPSYIILIKGKWLTIPVLLRIVFLFIFICLCKPKMFGLDAFNDAIPLVVTAIMSITSGYLSSLIMISMHGCVENYEKEIASTMMSFFLSFGLNAGTFSGLIISFILGAIFKDGTPYIE
ncbi:hypothetical protein ABK040_006391 [Willaertia magna]